MERKATQTEQVKELTKQIEEGIQSLRNSEKYKEFLVMQSKFPNYSWRNCALIDLQSHGTATAVMSYTGWRKLDRYVVKGARGLKIFAPCPYRKTQKIETIDAHGNRKTEERVITQTWFKPVTVFDVSDTDGKPLPELAHKLTGSVEDYAELLETIRRVSPVPIMFEKIPGTANGYFSSGEQKIVIANDLSELHAIHTALHELGHAVLDASGIDREHSRSRKEVEAESISFICLNALLGDAVTPEMIGDYSFGYIESWDAEQTEFKAALSTIQKTAAELISQVEQERQKLRQKSPEEDAELNSSQHWNQSTSRQAESNSTWYRNQANRQKESNSDLNQRLERRRQAPGRAR